MKKGFTLIELLGVIVILGVLTMLIAPNMVKVSNNTKEKLYDAKKKKIEGAARERGYDLIDDLGIIYSATTPTSSTKKYTVKQLIQDGYLSSEDKKYNTSGNESDMKYENPTNGENMKDCQVYVWYYKEKTSSAGGKVMAKLIQTDDKCKCRGC